MRRVLVTGASTPLGRRVIGRLQRRDGVQDVIGVDVRRGVIDAAAPPRHRSLAELIDAARPDTVIHAAMCHTRAGSAVDGAADVISTQHLAAAISRDTAVRAVVAVSSTEVYAPGSAAPQWRSEDEPLHPAAGSRAGVVLEAEDYVRDLARRQPHISVALLRLADLAGPGVRAPLTALWQRRFVPYVPGYDPPVQLLHVDDAVRAVEHAAGGELAGTFNVAGPGVVTWRDTARLARRLAVPGAVVPDRVAPALARIGVPCVPASMFDVLRFGRCADTTAFAATSFTADLSTRSCIRADLVDAATARRR